MSEIDRVNLSIEAHFQVYGNPRKHPKEMGELAHALVKCVCASTARAAAQAAETKSEIDPVVLDRLVKAEAAAQALDAATKDSTMTAKIEDILVGHGWDKADAADAAKNPFIGQTSDKILTVDNFKKAAELAMIARRALYPLNGENPWDPDRDPREALYDPDDIYSFGIFDTFVEPIQELLPPLYRLSTEGWDPDEASEPLPEQVSTAVIAPPKKQKPAKRVVTKKLAKRCKGKTKAGTQCKRNVAPGRRSYCDAHGGK